MNIKNMNLNVFVIGSGRAAQALCESLRIVELIEPSFSVASLRKVERGALLNGITKGAENPILLIANPHGLHAKAILEADREGFKLIVCEKPAATSIEQVNLLRSVKTPVAICHGYRQGWGIQKLKSQINAGDFGELISIEGRYWQSSAAQAALKHGPKTSWKNDPALAGSSDTLIDIAIHWLDAAFFLAGSSKPDQKNISLSFVNAETPHRDTHVHLNLKFLDGPRLFASVSKTVHGATNQFEINVIGSKKYASWKFLEPDLIEFGEGSIRQFISRSASESWGTGHPPHHGAGWLEGYIEILKNSLLTNLQQTPKSYPTLAEHLDVLDAVFG
jgi:predicted dehydrogenase